MTRVRVLPIETYGPHNPPRTAREGHEAIANGDYLPFIDAGLAGREVDVLPSPARSMLRRWLAVFPPPASFILGNAAYAPCGAIVGWLGPVSPDAFWCHARHVVASATGLRWQEGLGAHLIRWRHWRKAQGLLPLPSGTFTQAEALDAWRCLAAFLARVKGA